PGPPRAGRRPGPRPAAAFGTGAAWPRRRTGASPAAAFGTGAAWSRRRSACRSAAALGAGAACVGSRPGTRPVTATSRRMTRAVRVGIMIIGLALLIVAVVAAVADTDVVAVFTVAAIS